MYALDNNSGVVVMPEIKSQSFSPDEPRWFTEGGNGTAPSYPGADWFNIVQAELLNLVKVSGGTPHKSELNQVALAIQSMINKSLSTKNTISVLKGVASNGATLPLPRGYAEHQCYWIVSMSEDVALDRIENTNTGYTKTECYVDSDRRVVARVYSKAGQNTDSVTGKKFDNSRANYLIIGVK